MAIDIVANSRANYHYYRETPSSRSNYHYYSGTPSNRSNYHYYSGTPSRRSNYNYYSGTPVVVPNTITTVKPPVVVPITTTTVKPLVIIPSTTATRESPIVAPTTPTTTTVKPPKILTSKRSSLVNPNTKLIQADKPESELRVGDKCFNPKNITRFATYKDESIWVHRSEEDSIGTLRDESCFPVKKIKVVEVCWNGYPTGPDWFEH